LGAPRKVNMYNYLVDSHCHLFMLQHEKCMDISDVVERAKNYDVKIINNIATEESEFEEVIETSRHFSNVYATIGIHPSNIRDDIVTVDTLAKYAEQGRVIAVGESGLEYYCEPIVDKVRQKKNFEVHIEIARQKQLPLVIHSREADNDMIEILKSEMKNGEFSFVLHCFSSGKELCWTGLDLGGYISLSGIITFKNAENLRQIVKDVPINRLLLETDSPFLSPAPNRGKINEPFNVRNIANYLVDFLEKDFRVIQDVTTSNFLTLFNRVKEYEG